MISHYYKQYQKFKFFLGKRVWLLFRLSFVVGLFWFGVESSFIFVLQSFLVAIGLVDSKNTFLPTFFPIGISGAILTLLGFGLLRSVAIFLRQFFSEIANQAFMRNQRDRTFEYALSDRAAVSTPQVLTVFNDQIPQGAYVVQGVLNTLNILVSCACLFFLGIRLAPYELGIGMSSLLLLFLSLTFINKKISQLGANLFEETNRLNQTLIVGLRNHFLLKVYNLTHREINAGKSTALRYERFFNRYIVFSTLKTAFPQFAGTIVVCIVCFVSNKYIHTPSAKLISFIYIFMRLAQGLSDASGLMLNIRFRFDIFKNLYQWNLRSEAFISTKGSRSATVLEQKNLLADDQLSIDVRDVGFNYPNGAEVLSNLNLRISIGDVLLLKGPSGSGKSTLLTLLLGMQHPTRGQVLINDKLIENYRDSLAGLTAYVGPESFMIEGTIRENLNYLNTRTSLIDDDFWDVLKKAQINDLVRKNEKGLEWYLREDTELSTGQKQRMAIARALLRKPKIFVLDEGTANLDLATEKEIISVIKNISKDMMVIVVSHKDSFDEVATQKIDLIFNEGLVAATLFKAKDVESSLREK
jgi:ABC-type multidrug transport system fused ATPase/permease subunit